LTKSSAGRFKRKAGDGVERATVTTTYSVAGWRSAVSAQSSDYVSDEVCARSNTNVWLFIRFGFNYKRQP